MRNILLVHSDGQARASLAALLRRNIECVVLEAGSAEEALDIIQAEDEEICLLITELFPSGRKGLDLLRQAQTAQPGIVTLPSVPLGDRAAINEILRMGAFGYVNEPLDSEEVLIIAARALNFYDLQVHRRQRGRKFRKLDGFNGIFGESPSMRKLFSMLDKIAEDGDSTVLILGESGTGKEMVARAIHARGPRQEKNFVPVNCAAIPDELLESELFGYVKGAFTGANKSKIGRLQYAQGGTLFLDEIGDMKPGLQAKLLRVLQEREFEPVGGVQPVPADIRVIAATHQNLEQAVAEGRFREDLFYRLNVLPVNIPPLRDRRLDIPLLIQRFVQAFNRAKKNCFKGFDDRALKALLDYPWPGNVRELENLVQRMSIFHRGSVATYADLPDTFKGHPVPEESPGTRADLASVLPDLDTNGPIDFDALINEVENQLILHALSQTDGNKKEAAALLNMKRTTLLQKIKKKQLDFTEGPPSMAG